MKKIILNRRGCFLNKALKSKLHTGIIELRTYQSKPDEMNNYKNRSQLVAPTRLKYMEDRWKLYLYPDTGYGTLQDFLHIYHYKDGLEERSDIRMKMALDSNWMEFLDTSRK